MAEAEKQNCKFLLLRYVPDTVKNEFVNIGLVLLPPDAPAELRFAEDWSRVLRLDPAADVELLTAFAAELRQRMSGNDKDVVLKKIDDWFSTSLQASELKACVTDSPAHEADELARLYLESPRRKAVSRESGARQMMLRRMRKEFELSGALRGIESKIPVSRYTHSGDPLKIDYGYGAGPLIKMFHATPLKTDINLAKALAFTAPRLAEGIRKAEGRDLLLSAIVEDDLKREDATIGFALETLEQQSIRVIPVSQLPKIAATAAREIGR
jgi:DUF3037 family protein